MTSAEGTPELVGRLVLWGRRAIAAARTVAKALETAGDTGLIDQGPGRRVAFRADLVPIFAGTLLEWVRSEFPGRGHRQATLVFAEPCETSAPDLVALVGNRAHDLAQWDLEDRGLSALLGREGCDDLADQARFDAAESLALIRVQGGQASREEHGRRVSVDNGHSFPLGGFSGSCVLDGDLEPVLPWLALLTLRGAGGHTSFGLGDVTLVLGQESATGSRQPRSAALLLIGDERIPTVIPLLNGPLPSEAFLLHSVETRVAMEDVSAWLSGRGVAVTAVEVDPLDYVHLRGVVGHLLKNRSAGSVTVNLTGGTVPMSLATAEVARENGHRTLYVDTRHRTLWQVYPDPTSAPLEARFEVRDFFLLHGQPWNPSPAPPPAWLDAARRIGCDFEKLQGLVEKLRLGNGCRISTRANPAWAPFLTHCEEAGLVRRAEPRSHGWEDTGTGFFQRNEWLEAMVFAALQDAGCDDISCRLEVTDTAMELDVAGTKGPILIVCSCRSGRMEEAHLDQLDAKARRVGGAFCRKLVALAEAGVEVWRHDAKAGQPARATFAVRAKALGIDVIYREGLPTLADAIREILETPPGQAG